MLVKLVRKLAERLDDVDLSRSVVGDVLNVSEREGTLLMAEGWAVPAADGERSRRQHSRAPLPLAKAADGSRRKS
jgi:hypothetical protein